MAVLGPPTVPGVTPATGVAGGYGSASGGLHRWGGTGGAPAGIGDQRRKRLVKALRAGADPTALMAPGGLNAFRTANPGVVGGGRRPDAPEMMSGMYGDPNRYAGSPGMMNSVRAANSGNAAAMAQLGQGQRVGRQPIQSSLMRSPLRVR